MKLSNAARVLSNDANDSSTSSVEEVAEITKLLQNVDGNILAKVMNVLRPEFNVVLVGEGGVGKTALVKSFLTDASKKEHYPADSEYHALVFRTNRGHVIKFNVWETTGKYGSLRVEPFCAEAHGAILLFDVTSSSTYKDVPNWYRDFAYASKNTNMVLCGNKVEMKDRKVKLKQMTFHRKKNLQCYDISTARKHNTVKPFLWLARQLANDSDLMFVGKPAVRPVITNATYEAEQAHAMAQTLSSDGNDEN